MNLAIIKPQTPILPTPNPNLSLPLTRYNFISFHSAYTVTFIITPITNFKILNSFVNIKPLNSHVA